MKVQSFNKDFFLDLVDNLSSTKINYSIIGDYQNLPDSVGHDIDIWTDDLDAFRKVLLDSISRTGFRLLIDNETANGCNVAFYRRDADTITLMKIDVLVDTSCASIPLVESKVMKNNILPYKNFFVANPESEAVMHFLYPMFQWGHIKKEIYKDEIFKYKESPIFKETFIKIWGKSLSDKIISLIAEKDWKEIEKIMPVLKRRALFKALLKTSFYTKNLKKVVTVIKRKLHPSGFCIAFCGLDGAGKTTIIDELYKMFVDLLKSKKVFYGYWRPFVLPEIRELIGRENSKAHVDKEAQKGKTIIAPENKGSGVLFSTFKLFYYWLDYMLANMKYGSIRERGGVVFFDRHYLDMIVFPRRFGLNVPHWLMIILYKFIPKADQTFFLYCSPEEIRKRKEEFSVEEIKIQTEGYLNYGKNIKNFHPIETNKTIAEEIDEILSHMSINK